MKFKVHWIIDGIAEIEGESKEDAEKKLQESFEEYVKNSEDLMNKFIGVKSKTHNNMAHEVAVTFLNKLYGEKLPKKAENYLAQATNKSWNAGLFNKAFFMSNANYYYTNKGFAGIIFINNNIDVTSSWIIFSLP